MKKKQSSISSIGLIRAFGYSISFILMLFGSYIFSMKNDSKYIVPYLLCSYFFAFFITYNLINVIVIPIISKSTEEEKIDIKTTFDDIFCLFLSWMFWLTYGTIFSPVSGTFGSAWMYIQSLISMILVFLSYVPQILRNKIHMWTVIGIYSVLTLFFFTTDSISYNLSSFILVFRVFLFAVIYIINDHRLQIPAPIVNRIGSGISKKLHMENLVNEECIGNSFDFEDNKYLKEEILRRRFTALLRAYWVLSSSSRFAVLGVFQIVPILMFGYCTCATKATAEKKKVQLNVEQKKKQRVEKDDEKSTTEEDTSIEIEDENISKKPKPRVEKRKEEKKEKKKQRSKENDSSGIDQIDEETLKIIMDKINA
jgi:hypothetical protein